MYINLNSAWNSWFGIQTFRCVDKLEVVLAEYEISWEQCLQRALHPTPAALTFSKLLQIDILTCVEQLAEQIM